MTATADLPRALSTPRSWGRSTRRCASAPRCPAAMSSPRRPTCRPGGVGLEDTEDIALDPDDLDGHDGIGTGG